MAWILLAISGLLEVVWATAMKASQGFSRPRETLVMVLAMLVGLWLLEVAMRELPLGTAYSVWVGIGAVGTVAAGAIWWHEPLSLLRLGSVTLILAGIVGLRLSTAQG